MFSRKLIAVTAGTVLACGTILGSGVANAGSATDTVACVVNGQVVVHGGPGLTATTNDTFNFTDTTLLCEGVSPFAGSYNVTAFGTANGENCALGQGSGTLGGAVTGSFTFTRVGPATIVKGTVSNGSASGTFVATLAFIPTSGPCLAGSGDTNADLIGAAAVEDVV